MKGMKRHGPFSRGERCFCGGEGRLWFNLLNEKKNVIMRYSKSKRKWKKLTLVAKCNTKGPPNGRTEQKEAEEVEQRRVTQKTSDARLPFPAFGSAHVNQGEKFESGLFLILGHIFFGGAFAVIFVYRSLCVLPSSFHLFKGLMILIII